MEQEQSKRMTKDAIIRELIELLNQNQQRGAANDVYEMAAYIDAMETKMDAVLQELLEVKKQLAEMEQRQERKAVREVLSETVGKLEQQCQKLKQQLFEIKTEVKTKAAEIVTEVKQKGKKALNKVSEFLGIKEKLQRFRNNVQESITEIDKSIGKINALGTGMREAVQKAANTIRTFVNKPEKEYGEKKFSKTELLKKPLQAKRKLLSGILKCADAAIEKTEQLEAEVRQYHTDKAERENESIANVEAVNPIELARVAEPEFQYGAEAFEAHQQEATKAMTEDKATKNMPVKSGKSR